MSGDIVERLRAWVYTDSLYATAREAADEIERLRHRVRFADAVIRSGNVATLTEDELKAVKEASEFYIGTCTGKAFGGLLERLG